MTELRKLWTDALPPFPEADVAAVRARAGERTAEVCACFWLYRYLHRCPTPDAVLMGDACFARFSRHLAALDDVALTDRFAEYLRQDTLEPKPFSDFLAFAGETGGAA